MCKNFNAKNIIILKCSQKSEKLIDVKNMLNICSIHVQRKIKMFMHYWVLISSSNIKISREREIREQTEKRRDSKEKQGVVARWFNVEDACLYPVWLQRNTLRAASTTAITTVEQHQRPTRVLEQQLYNRLVFYGRFMNAALPFVRTGDPRQESSQKKIGQKGNEKERTEHSGEDFHS